MRILFSILLTLFFLSANAQNGVITGTVIETANADAIAYGAIVRIDSTKLGGFVQLDSLFRISNVPPGIYSVSCDYIGYMHAVVQNVEVRAGDTTRVDIRLVPLEMGTFVFWEPRPVSPFIIDEDVHEGNGSTNGLGGTALAQLNVTDAGQAGKKIPGITLVDNRFLIIRGLSERYNAVLLNNVLAPSVETDVKSFSFNLIPAQMINRMMVYKSPSPELPGEFSGGAVKITTTDVPDKTVLSCNYQIGYRHGTTFQDFRMNRVGNRDWLGLGATTRALPGGFAVNVRNLSANPAALQAAGSSLPNTWGFETAAALPDQRFNVTYCYRNANDTAHPHVQFGNITSLNYSNTNAYREVRKTDYYPFTPGQKSSDTIIDYYDANYINSVRISFVQNNALRFAKPGKNQHLFTMKHLFNQMGDNESSFREGSNYEDGELRREYSFHYVQKTVYTGQFSGEHMLNNEHTRIDYTGAYSFAQRSDPDWKRARYSRPFGAAANDPYYLYVPISAQPFFLSRLYTAMNERTVAGAVNVAHDFMQNSDSSASKQKLLFTVQAGVYAERKEREFIVRNLGYKAATVGTYGNFNLLTLPIDSIFASSNINTTNGFAIDEDTKKADAYRASNRMLAGYAMAVIPVGRFKGKTDGEQHERIRISAGVRAEHNIQQLHGNKMNGDTVIVNNDQLLLLPSVNAAFNFTERMLLRASYGKTVNRPEFREIAPLYFFDFMTNAINVGNDSLKTATIDNIDFRWEFYPSPGEVITVGGFYKHFTNPIEMYFVPGIGGGGVRSFTWGNAPEATSYGVEAEIRKAFDSLRTPVLRDLSVSVNAAYIFSRIVLSNSYTGPQAVQRPMMGQSPWIVNAGLYYQTDSTGWQVNVNYNIIGPRVVVAGILDVPEIYEMPRHQLDVSVVKAFGRYDHIDLRISFNDVLNQEVLLLQDRESDGVLDRSLDNRMQSYRPGSSFTAGITIRFPGKKERAVYTATGR